MAGSSQACALTRPYPINDPNYAMVDLEFDSTRVTEAFLATLRELWGRVAGTVRTNPRVQIVETVESKEY